MNPSLRTLIRDLHRRRGRERRGLVLAEGVRLVEEALAAKIPIKSVVTSTALEATTRGAALKAALTRAAAPMTDVTDDELRELADTDHPQGVIAVLAPPVTTLDQLTPGPRAVFVILDAVQDPGNVGTIARTAWAFGASGLIALPGTAELGNPKTLRASMGGLFRIPAAAASESDAEAWLGQHQVTVVATGSGGEPFEPESLPLPLALLLGNEGAGAGSGLAGRASRRVTIPLASGVESLNVAVAAGILLHGVARGR